MKIFELAKQVAWGILESKVTDVVNQKSNNTRRFEDLAFGTGGIGESSTLNSSRDYLNAFQLMNYIASCAGTIARDASRLEWQLIDNTGKPVVDKAIFNLLNNPFQDITYSDFIQIAMLHLLLDGNSFFLLNPTSAYDQITNKFSEIVILNPSLVYVYDETEVLMLANTIRNSYGVSKYRAMFYNEQKLVPREYMQQAKLLGPHNMLRGMGVVQQNAPALDADRFTSLYNNAFYSNGAKTNLILSPKSDEAYNPAAYKSTQDKFMGSNTGYQQWGKPMFLPMSIDAKVVTMSNTDMQFLDQLKMTRENIVSYFNIPPVISQLYNTAKYDSAEEQMATYYARTLPGWISPIQEAMSKICQRINPNIRFQFVMPNRLISSDAKDMFDRGAITKNEYRANFGMHKIENNPDMERFFMLGSYLTADQVTATVDLPTTPDTPPSPGKESIVEQTK